jgi:hypothetical protein
MFLSADLVTMKGGVMNRRSNEFEPVTDFDADRVVDLDDGSELVVPATVDADERFEILDDDSDVPPTPTF